MPDNPRRLLLRLSVKFLFLAAAILSGYVLFSSTEKPQKHAEPVNLLQVELAPVERTTVTRRQWAGGNLILLQRPHPTPAVKEALEAKLLDPLSQSARQPTGLSKRGRSRQSGLFLAYDRGTDMGCPLEWVPGGNRQAPHQPWPGGFRDSCRGSWYDAAGRVFKGQEAQRNLDIPPYRLVKPDLLEVGINGDNPASVK